MLITNFDALQSKGQSTVLMEIQENISKTLVPTLDSYDLKLCLMTLKSRDSQHIIDFENENTRRNISNFELSKGEPTLSHCAWARTFDLVIQW